jgi:hypothetical protein
MQMSRRLHFVGSLPSELCVSPRAAMQWILERSAGYRLTALPCDLDPNWLLDYLRNLARRDVFMIVRPGEYGDYSDFRSYGVQRGHKLLPVHVSMQREDRLRTVLKEFRTMRDQYPELAGVRLQISLPNPLDQALFVFTGRPWLALRYLRVFVQATVNEVAALTADAGQDLVWQLETPSALVSMDMARRLPGGRVIAARLHAAQVAGLLARFPSEAEVSLHLCYGDYRNTELVSPRDLGPAVRYLNLLAVALRRRRLPLPPVHIPAAYGAHPAPKAESFYRPLHRLAPDWLVIAGVAAAADRPGGMESLRTLEAAMGRPAYAVATACGLGRHTPEAAGTAVEAMIAAAAQPY